MVHVAYDPLAAVVDWLDACRARHLTRVLDFYEAAATMECSCSGLPTLRGLGDLARYWEHRLAKAVPEAFSLTNILPGHDESSVVLDYVSYEGKPVRMLFQFGSSGKIASMVCGPMVQS